MEDIGYATGRQGKPMSVYRLSALFCLAVLITLLGSEPAMAANIGDVLTNVKNSLRSVPTLLSAFAYLAGIILVIQGIFKFKDSVESPAQNPISGGVKRFAAGGGLLSATYLTSALRGSLAGGGLGNITSGSGRSGAALSGTGMDVMIYKFMTVAYGPSIVLLSAFAWIAGIILLLTGISRLTKSAQEGPRGPGGLGTIITFLVAGVLFSIGGMISTFLKSIFGAGGGSIASRSQITGLMSGADAYKVQTVIDAVMAFIMIVGLIAFIRGWFVLKAFADGGSQNATIAQALTFLFGGAVAINLGQFINILQNSFGIGGTLTFS